MVLVSGTRDPAKQGREGGSQFMLAPRCPAGVPFALRTHRPPTGCSAGPVLRCRAAGGLPGSAHHRQCHNHYIILSFEHRIRCSEDEPCCAAMADGHGGIPSAISVMEPKCHPHNAPAGARWRRVCRNPTNHRIIITPLHFHRSSPSLRRGLRPLQIESCFRRSIRDGFQPPVAALRAY